MFDPESDGIRAFKGGCLGTTVADPSFGRRRAFRL